MFLTLISSSFPKVKQIGVIIRFLLIAAIIFLRVPQESGGFSSFATKSNLLGSPNKSQRSFNIMIGSLVFFYFLIALVINSTVTDNYNY